MNVEEEIGSLKLAVELLVKAQQHTNNATRRLSEVVNIDRDTNVLNIQGVLGMLDSLERDLAKLRQEVTGDRP